MSRWGVVCILLLAVAPWAMAQAAPDLMNYQGTLVDSGGQLAETGAYAVQFRIWDEAVGGNLVWGPQVFDGAAAPGHSALVDVVDGAFNVVLGPDDTSSRALTDAFDGAERYLQIAVEDPVTKAYTWMTPRQQILSTPFALKATDAGNADTLDGLHAWFLRNADNLNAGTLPTDRFSAADDLAAEGKLDNNAGTDLLTRAQADSRYANENEANSVTSDMIVDGTVAAADLHDGTVLAEIVDDDGAGSGLDADRLDGQHASYFGNSSNQNAGTLNTDRFSAIDDLTREGLLNNDAATDILTRTQADGRFVNEGQANSVTSSMITDGQVTASDVRDGVALAEILDDDGVGSGLDADLLDGQHGSFYRNATNLSTGTLNNGRFSAYSDLSAEGKIGTGLTQVAPGHHMLHGISNSASGDDAAVSGGESNAATGSHAVIGGGEDNTADGSHSVIGGGRNNEALANFATIGGGGSGNAEWGNEVLDALGTIGGGSRNTVGLDDGDPGEQTVATVAGGYHNTASAYRATVGGGNENTASGQTSTLSGGSNNTASGSGATIGGGVYNYATAQYSAVGGGGWNSASALHATTGGGLSNVASGEYSTVGGGDDNTASGDLSVVAGGGSNVAEARLATIGGGGTADGLGATIGHQVFDNFGTIAGGYHNTAGDDDGDPETQSSATVAGGSLNEAEGGYSSVGGGRQNQATGSFATIPGGDANEASGSWSFAAGKRAHALHNGSFVWADTTNDDFASTADKQFIVRADGGVGLGTDSPSGQLHVAESVAGTASLGNHVAIVDNRSTDSSSGPDVLALRSNVSEPSDSTNFITFFDNSDAIGAIEGDGSGGIFFKSGGADFAEYLPKRTPTEALEAAEVVGVHASGVSRDTEGAERVAVITTAPIVLGNAPKSEDEDNQAAVAFLGQVPVKVRGPVQAGEYLIASGNDGTATASDTVSAELMPLVVGQALESSAEPGLKKVRASVGLSPTKLWSQALQERDGRIAAMQEELDALKTAVAALAAK